MKNFNCANCHQTFKKSSEHEALQEYLENFPHLPTVQKIIVCDTCHFEIMEWVASLTPDQVKQIEMQYH